MSSAALNYNSDPVSEFHQAMADAGILSDEVPIADGQLHRFKADGDKTGSKNGWYILFNDGNPAGRFGSWKYGINETWSLKNYKDFTPQQKAEYAKQMAQAKTEREKAQAVAHKEARAAALRLWSEASPETGNHKYLQDKGVQAYRIRSNGADLLIPLRDSGGTLHSIQTIDEHGKKLFLSGGAIRGHYFGIGKPNGKMVIAEGYSTAASIYESTGLAVAVAFNSGNLIQVAKALRGKYPDIEIIIAGDNDTQTEGNPGKSKATEAAKAVNGKLVIPEFKDKSNGATDFNDLHLLEGLESVKEQINNHLSVPPVNESNNSLSVEPISLDIQKPLKLPKEIFTGWFGDMVASVSKATETPIELPALLGLSVVATACQRKFVVELEQNYQEPLNIWTVIALEPGNRKTAVLQAMSKPLMEWEREAIDQVSTEIVKIEAERKNQEAQINSLRSQYAKAKATEEEDLGKEIVHLETTLPEIPSIPRLWAQDITPEKLGQLMADNDERMSVLSDEGGIFDILAGRYNSGIPNLDLFLQSHSGAPHRVDRGSRKAVRMDSPALTMGLSPQPEVLKSLTSKDGFRGRGLLARFLYVLPESRLGFRLLSCEPVTDDVLHKYNSGIRSLIDINPATNSSDEINPYLLKLTSKAYGLWKEFQREVEKDMRDGGTFEYIKDWAGKLPGAVGRLAGLLHCVEYANEQPWAIEINDETLNRALNLAAFLSRHALSAFDLMGADDDLNSARKVWQWVERNRRESFSARDCFEALKGTYKRMAGINPAFDVLMERHYIFELPQTQSVGRPRRVFNVNPMITEKWS